MHLVKLKPKRRCRIPRRPHPNLDCIFGRFERTEDALDESGADITDLEPLHSQPRH